MNWKPEVIVKKTNNGYQLQIDDDKTVVKKEDTYIVRSIEKGITDDKWLTAIVMKTEQIEEVFARFRLAQFVLDYGEYILNDVGHMIIEP
ncbi:hypothetical protein [Anaerosporobacter faecicola]|uniref:hypothetical protein n=1 Tax=Anaerosporobacter faecicola TaxID=2718714 RepID=UPI00143A3D7D|nr:hypothetical protein [Anaerosporobacter faecicola]